MIGSSVEEMKRNLLEIKNKIMENKLKKIEKDVEELKNLLIKFLAEAETESLDERWSIKRCYEYLGCSRSTFNIKLRPQITEYKEKGKAARYSSSEIRELKKSLEQAKVRKVQAAR